MPFNTNPVTSGDCELLANRQAVDSQMSSFLCYPPRPAGFLMYLFIQSRQITVETQLQTAEMCQFNAADRKALHCQDWFSTK